MGRPLVWYLATSYLALTVVAVAVTSAYALLAMRTFHRSEVSADLAARTRIIERQIRPILSGGDGAELEALGVKLAEAGGVRLTVIAGDGRVVFESHEDFAALDRHDDRPEVREALEGATGSAVRYSATLDREMLYVARSVESGEEVEWVVRAALPMSALGEATATFYRNVGLGGLLIALLAALTALALSRRISRPLTLMSQTAKRFAEGDFTDRLPYVGCEEVDTLAEALSTMAVQLDERIRTISAQSEERSAILSGMVEGVMGIGADETIVSMNGAAGRMLEIDPDRAQGKMLEEVVRSSALRAFIHRLLSGGSCLEEDLPLLHGDRQVHARGSVLARSGLAAVVVLHDVTEVRRLERVRKEFVSNVSHELRTPLTSMKGFLETLLDERQPTPEKAKHFLRIVAAQADRLGTLIEDLLLLSRLDRLQSGGELGFEEFDLQVSLQEVVEECSPRAVEHGAEIRFSCPPGLSIRANRVLIEQAVLNLLDNAIRHSGSRDPIDVTVTEHMGWVALSVADRGKGIERSHQPRLFERFYRVDRARSRKAGGTGLGLSIVKHIAEAHGGRAMVESVPGKGSVFTLTLPGTSERAAATAR